MTAAPLAAIGFSLPLEAPRGLDERRRLAGKPALEVAKEFEALLLAQVIGAMRRTVPDGGLFGTSPERRVLDGAFDQELAKSLAARADLGIARAIARQVDARLGTGPRAGTESAGQRTSAAREEAAETLVHALASESARATRAARAASGGAPVVAVVGPSRTGEGRPLVAPVEGRVSSVFGVRRDPLTGESRFHGGLDVAVERGTPIRAAADGEVVFSGWRDEGGRVVQIRHTGGLVTTYAHAERILVQAGDRVTAADVVATVGSSGRSTGPHLHFAVSRDGQVVDPAELLELDPEHDGRRATLAARAGRT